MISTVREQPIGSEKIYLQVPVILRCFMQLKPNPEDSIAKCMSEAGKNPVIMLILIT